MRAFWLWSHWGGLRASGCRHQDGLCPCERTSVEVVLTRSHIEYISVRGSSKAPGLASEVEGLLDRDRPATDVDVPEVALVVP